MAVHNHANSAEKLACQVCNPSSNPQLDLAWQTYLCNRGAMSEDFYEVARCAFIAAWHAGRAAPETPDGMFDRYPVGTIFQKKQSGNITAMTPDGVTHYDVSSTHSEKCRCGRPDVRGMDHRTDGPCKIRSEEPRETPASKKTPPRGAWLQGETREAHFFQLTHDDEWHYNCICLGASYPLSMHPATGTAPRAKLCNEIWEHARSVQEPRETSEELVGCGNCAEAHNVLTAAGIADGDLAEKIDDLVAERDAALEALRRIRDQSAQSYEDPEQEAYASRDIARKALDGSSEEPKAVSCVFRRGCPNPAACITAGCCQCLERLPEKASGTRLVEQRNGFKDGSTVYERTQVSPPDCPEPCCTVDKPLPVKTTAAQCRHYWHEYSNRCRLPEGHECDHDFPGIDGRLPETGY